MQLRLRQVRGRIAEAARRVGRPDDSVALVAVSKTFGAAEIAAAAAAGQRSFGENYLQEAAAKIDALRESMPGAGLEWHFIGPIQSNKTREIAARFDWVQSIDRLKVAERLSAQRPPGLPPLDVLIEVNVSGEASKSGLAPQDLDAVSEQVARLARLRLRGLMAIPEPQEDPDRQRPPFARMRELFERARTRLHAVAPDFDTLSMGMSGDFESAIAEGSTMVRLGTAIFGERR
ncbi:MAG TPA: YggS family pyridoxal phosphate-dependent enzyme [Burkholderiaceae bacterium]